MALALAARYPHLRVEGVEASRVDVQIARSLNRSSNVNFRHGLAEEGVWKHGKMPDLIEPIEFGSLFVSYSKS